jgi:hypothetical protein
MRKKTTRRHTALGLNAPACFQVTPIGILFEQGVNNAPKMINETEKVCRKGPAE